MKVILTNKPEQKWFSIESGLADNVRHFDHHKKEHRHYPSPCNNPEIPVLPEGSVVQVTHLDADTFGGLLRMFGRLDLLEGLDLEHMELVDTNGSSVSTKDNITNQYMVGIYSLTRDLKFPRCSDEPQDITDKVMSLMEFTPDQIVEKGRDVMNKEEEAYKRCKISSDSFVGLWALGSEDMMDPSRPYQDGLKVSVIYREHYGSISIYGDPELKKTHPELSFQGREWGGISFAGHPLACGSPRDGRSFSLEDAKRVYLDIRTNLELLVGDIKKRL